MKREEKWEKGIDQKIAEEIKKFYQFIITNELGECDGYDEWCEAYLYKKTDKLMSCAIEENKSILDCIDEEKKRLVGW